MLSAPQTLGQPGWLGFEPTLGVEQEAQHEEPLKVERPVPSVTVERPSVGSIASGLSGLQDEERLGAFQGSFILS